MGHVNPTSGAGNTPQPKPVKTPPPLDTDSSSALEKEFANDPKLSGRFTSGLEGELNKDPEFAAKFKAGLMRDMQSQMDHQKRYHEQQEAFRKEQNPQ